MEATKIVEESTRYTILEDHVADTRVVKTTSINHATEDGKPEIELYTASIGYSGGPNLIWHGYDLGAKPFYGFGKTPQEAILDALRVVNRQIEAKMDAVDLIRILVKEKDAS